MFETTTVSSMSLITATAGVAGRMKTWPRAGTAWCPRSSSATASTEFGPGRSRAPVMAPSTSKTPS